MRPGASVSALDSGAREIRARRRSTPPCPRCGAPVTWRWGQFAGRSRYACPRCGRTFTALTGTPQAYSKLQHLWRLHGQCLTESLSVRRTAARLGVSPSTAFRWRHRVINSWLLRNRPALAGVVEIAASFYPACRKGERSLPRPARRRAGEYWLTADHVYLALLRDQSGNGTGLSLGLKFPTLGRLSLTLKPLLAQATALHTVCHAWFRLFARVLRLPHRAGLMGNLSFPESLHSAGLAYARLRQWLKHFYGVHMRYLDRYLAWFDVLDGVASDGAQPHAA